MEIENKRKQLTFRSWHRGTKEMDLIMGSFADHNLEDYGAEELELYAQILEISDPDLYNWISGKEEAPANVRNDVFDALLNHKFTEN